MYTCCIYDNLGPIKAFRKKTRRSLVKQYNFI